MPTFTLSWPKSPELRIEARDMAALLAYVREAAERYEASNGLRGFPKPIKIEQGA